MSAPIARTGFLRSWPGRSKVCLESASFTFVTTAEKSLVFSIARVSGWDNATGRFRVECNGESDFLASWVGWFLVYGPFARSRTLLWRTLVSWRVGFCWDFGIEVEKATTQDAQRLRDPFCSERWPRLKILKISLLLQASPFRIRSIGAPAECC